MIIIILMVTRRLGAAGRPARIEFASRANTGGANLARARAGARWPAPRRQKQCDKCSCAPGRLIVNMCARPAS